jgi:hypothetical protein
MSDEFKTLVDSSFDNGVPFWVFTSDYIFGMVPSDTNGERWKEVSFTFDDPDEPFYSTERQADLSFQFLLEEVEKGVSFYVEDLKVPAIKEFVKSLEEKPGPEKMNLFIAEMINNSSKYSTNLPIVKNKEGLTELKSKIP